MSGHVNLVCVLWRHGRSGYPDHDCAQRLMNETDR
jgi:hypothetical protein